MREVAVIKKVGSQWCIFSEKTGKRLGCYSSKKKAQERLAQIEYFKHTRSGTYECYCNECGYEFTTYKPCWVTRCPICGDDDIEEIRGEIY
jgi:predicted Zn-ribbon and HTH transcriptional regulator